jgi:hypothetical protein
MTLDEDDIYVQRDAFSKLYLEAEEKTLNLLSNLVSSFDSKRGYFLLLYIYSNLL